MLKKKKIGKWWFECLWNWKAFGFGIAISWEFEFEFQMIFGWLCFGIDKEMKRKKNE